MVAQHTLGPWFVDEPFYHSGERQRVTPIYARDPNCLRGTWLVAWCHQNAVPAQEVKANARLIAAAPELLQALRGLHAAMAGYVNTPEEMLALDAAKAAIHKAAEHGG